MGFLSGLGKVLSIAAPIAAIPFTGGASALALGGAAGGAAGKILSGLGKAGDVLSGVGSVASGAAAGAGAGRKSEAELLLEQQRLKQQQARDVSDDAYRRGSFESTNQLDRAKFGQSQQNDALARPGLFAKNALAGGLMQGLQDVNISRPSGSTIPTFNVQGGLRPSAMGANARQAGGEMSRTALMNMLSGGPAPMALGEAPSLGAGYQPVADPSMPSAGLGSKLLGGLGLGGSLLGAIGKGLPQPPQNDGQQSSILGPPESLMTPAPAPQLATMDEADPRFQRPYRSAFMLPGQRIGGM